MRRVAEVSVQRAHHLAARLSGLEGIGLAEPDRPYLWEFALRVPGDAEAFAAALRREGIVAGLPLGRVDPARGDQLLVCCTETSSPASIERYVAAAARIAVPAGVGA
jgi:glycine dehydrogenase subunit 1